MVGPKLFALLAFLAAGFVYQSNAIAFRSKEVKVVVYYETMCPDCKIAFVDQIYPTYKELSDIMELEIVPYGNVDYREGVRHCQHGEIECFGNTIQACALHRLEFDKALDFITCMESDKHLPSKSAPKCANENKIDFQEIFECAMGQEGKDLTDEMEKKTGDHKYVPWYIINGEHTQEIQKQAESDLKKLVCDTYEGPLPKACIED